MSKYVDPYQHERSGIQDDYLKEICWIAKHYDCCVNEIKIDPYHPVVKFVYSLKMFGTAILT